MIRKSSHIGYLVSKTDADSGSNEIWLKAVGHAIGFFKDSHGTLTYGRQYFQNSRQPFAITLAGEKFYVLTSPKDVTAAYKDTEGLTFDVFVRDIMVSFGATPGAIQKMWLSASDDSTGFESSTPNPLHKCLAQLTRDFHKQQLHPGENLDALGSKFQTYIDELLRCDSLLPSTSSSPSSWKELSLVDWCGDVLLNAATRAFFGEKLLEIEPNLLRDFFDFDNNSWMLMYRYPPFLAKEMNRAKTRAIDGLTAYFALPKDQRTGEAWFVRTLEAEQRKLGIGDRDIATLILMVYWVVNSNTYKLCFWIFAYLLHDPVLLSTIRTETAPAVASTGVDMNHLLQSSPHLNSLFDEVLRLTNSSSSVRSVASETTINGFTLRTGTKVIIPYRQLHFNEAVFGTNAAHFDAERFMKNKDLNRSTSYRPFGGGSTYCPGRFIARQEVVAFVALVLGRYDLELAPSEIGGKTETFPALEEMKPCLGVMGPVTGDDLVIRVRRRQKT
ncbi:MAG: hypothetical protein M1830_009818 [Pleopsidium flavum]|nr:MAG: hypothetical protein M1830_009818 [Pleopsidium flavum]